MNPHHRFIEPLDVLVLRANKLFGDAGTYGEALVPPWPSVAAGALRSRMMADDPALSAAQLQDPAFFTLSAFHLARRIGERVEPLHSIPADVVIEGAGEVIKVMRPHALTPGLLSSAQLEQVPILAEAERGKPEAGYWLTQVGWSVYLAGQQLLPEHLVASKDLWSLESRVGVGLHATARRADDGKLFTTQAIAFRTGVGFLASARAERLPEQGLLRFGGDGRAATIAPCESELPPALPQPCGRFKVVLTTPGLFPQGWLPPAIDEARLWRLPGATARLVCAAIPRAQVVSGWDLARREPKPAQRVAPTGSVYWFDDFQGDTDELRKLSEHGLWGFPGQNDDPMRRAEGFNRCAIGGWID
ncbi:MAG: type III-B CRISPR module-associated protein Cmr3 [Gammaproteobacteria bacterium]|nr:type III-B CRISPR module-associated protein Cmr3 [Gammaproteobacteria bacterium]